MEALLAAGGLAMGLAATPHCALMCGSPCAAVTGGRRADSTLFLLGRAAGYAAVGAAAAAGVGAIGTWSRTVPLLQPLWTLLQLAFLALGLWWLATGRMPRRLLREGTSVVHVVPRRGRPWRAGLAGLAWVAWPCGALQAALLLAALANGAPGGALVMAAFALASTPALAAAPWLWAWWRRRAAPARLEAWGYRCAGAALALSASWALAATLRDRLAAACIA